jgi:glycosyltransferase involved in cell wall biosynthesis
MAEQQRLTVLHVTPSYKPAFGYGGPILSVARLCEAAHDGPYNLEPVVFTTTANGKKDLDFKFKGKRNIDGVPVFFYARLTGDHTHFSPALLLALHRYLRKARTEKQAVLVHIHSWWNLVAVLSAAITLVHAMPIIISPRGMITNYTRSFRNTFVKQVIHHFPGRYILKKAMLHATTALEAEDIRLNTPNCNITVIANLLTNSNPEFFAAEKLSLDSVHSGANRPKTIKTTPQLQMLFLSRIDQKKGLEMLFQALSTIDFPWTLTIAGAGPARYIRSLKQLSGTLKLKGHIQWEGQVANESKYSLIAEHDLLVLPSSNENFGNVVLESLLVGTAVLVSGGFGTLRIKIRVGLDMSSLTR